MANFYEKMMQRLSRNLLKIQNHHGTVTDYINFFNNIAKDSFLYEEELVEYFMNGLKNEIASIVRVCNPLILKEAIELALLQEKRLEEVKDLDKSVQERKHDLTLIVTEIEDACQDKLAEHFEYFQENEDKDENTSIDDVADAAEEATIQTFSIDSGDNPSEQGFTIEAIRISLSNAISCYSHDCGYEELEELCEVFTWCEESKDNFSHDEEAGVSHLKMIDTLSGINVELVLRGEYHTDDITWGGSIHNLGSLIEHDSKFSRWIPKAFGGRIEELQVSSVSCGLWQMVIVTSAEQMFTFGDGMYGALGHGDRTRTNMLREYEVLKCICAIQSACGIGFPSCSLFTSEDKVKVFVQIPQSGEVHSKFKVTNGKEVHEVLGHIIFIIWNWFYKDYMNKRDVTHPGNWRGEWIIAWILEDKDL